MEVAQSFRDKSRFILSLAAREMALCNASNLHVEELIGRQRAGNTHVKIIGRERAGPGSGSIPATAIQREDAHRASRLRDLECGLLLFAERTQFSCAARDHLFWNLISQDRRRCSGTRREGKYVEIRQRQTLTSESVAR